MKVCRLYETHLVFNKAEKRWAALALYDEQPLAGKREVLKLLKQHRDEVEAVINELDIEIEEEAWLEF